MRKVLEVLRYFAYLVFLSVLTAIDVYMLVHLHNLVDKIIIVVTAIGNTIASLYCLYKIEKLTTEEGS